MSATDRWNTLRDALKLAEQSAPYVDSEQWAVSAVVFLRREVAAALKQACEECERHNNRQNAIR